MAEAVRLLKEAEAAAQLGLCERTLRKERQAGRLPYILIGRCVRYSPADLQSYVEGARICQSASEREPRSTGTPSTSTVVDFVGQRAKRQSEQRRK